MKECNILVNKFLFVSVLEKFYVSMKQIAYNLLNCLYIRIKTKQVSQAEGHGFESRCPLFQNTFDFSRVFFLIQICRHTASFQYKNLATIAVSNHTERHFYKSCIVLFFPLSRHQHQQVRADICQLYYVSHQVFHKSCRF